VLLADSFSTVRTPSTRPSGVRVDSSCRWCCCRRCSLHEAAAAPRRRRSGAAMAQAHLRRGDMPFWSAVHVMHALSLHHLAIW
jgi:hypothetical protein